MHGVEVRLVDYDETKRPPMTIAFQDRFPEVSLLNETLRQAEQEL